MRILIVSVAAALLAACAPDAPNPPSGEPTPRPCPEGEPECGPAGI
jgi:hypothetical protein